MEPEVDQVFSMFPFVALSLRSLEKLLSFEPHSSPPPSFSSLPPLTPCRCWQPIHHRCLQSKSSYLIHVMPTTWCSFQYPGLLVPSSLFSNGFVIPSISATHFYSHTFDILIIKNCDTPKVNFRHPTFLPPPIIFWAFPLWYPTQSFYITRT